MKTDIIFIQFQLLIFSVSVLFSFFQFFPFPLLLALKELNSICSTSVMNMEDWSC